ncbi:MAG: tetratricopeptide repeat protein [Anaerolineae bacterium]|nr:tetratricopeptide repeat protein [Anaerolineae bacterium]
MSKRQPIPAPTLQKARKANALGLQQYERWEIDEAIESLNEAIRLNPEEPQHHLNLARALARYGDFDAARRALGSYIRYEPDKELSERFEQLFGEGMDEVETMLTEQMRKKSVALEVIGAAVQMWLEYRICLGRRPLVIRKPETWAAALDYTIRKVNFIELSQREIADLYGVSPSTVRAYHNDLVQTLDIMPCDYRYFRGEENPLDKLVEAAAMLEELEERFRRP